MQDARQLLTDDLIEKIEACAREQGRRPIEIVEEAVGRYMAQQRLQRLAERGEKLARSRGVRENDVPELVQQLRHENRRGL
jgi:hypothetical protein